MFHPTASILRVQGLNCRAAIHHNCNTHFTHHHCIQSMLAYNQMHMQTALLRATPADHHLACSPHMFELQLTPLLDCRPTGSTPSTYCSPPPNYSPQHHYNKLTLPLSCRPARSTHTTPSSEPPPPPNNHNTRYGPHYLDLRLTLPLNCKPARSTHATPSTDRSTAAT